MRKEHNKYSSDKWTLHPDREYRVGRSTDCDIHIAHFTVSRVHLSITLCPAMKEVIVKDLGSANGTFIQGVRIEGTAVVKTGVEILLGDSGKYLSFREKGHRDRDDDSHLSMSAKRDAVWDGMGDEDTISMGKENTYTCPVDKHKSAHKNEGKYAHDGESNDNGKKGEIIQKEKLIEMTPGRRAPKCSSRGAQTPKEVLTPRVLRNRQPSCATRERSREMEKHHGRQ